MEPSSSLYSSIWRILNVMILDFVACDSLTDQIVELVDNLTSTSKVNRVEVIDENGRSYSNWNVENVVSFQLQDDNRTLKVFVDKKDKQSQKTPAEIAFYQTYHRFPDEMDNYLFSPWNIFENAFYMGMKNKTN